MSRDMSQTTSKRPSKVTVGQFLASADDIGSAEWDRRLLDSALMIRKKWQDGALSNEEGDVIKAVLDGSSLIECAREGVIIYIRHCAHLLELQAKIKRTKQALGKDDFFYFLRKAILGDRLLSPHGKRFWLIYIAIRQYNLSQGLKNIFLGELLTQFESYIKNGFFEWRFEGEKNLPPNLVEITASQVKIVEYGEPHITSAIKKRLSRKEGFDLTYQTFEHMSSYQGYTYLQHILRIS